MKSFFGQRKIFPFFQLFGLYLGAILCLFIWGLSVTGILNGASSFIYDSFARITPQQNGNSEDILLVEADYSSQSQGDETWLRLLETLDHKGARQVVFFFLPGNVSANFYQTASSLDYVFFGRKVIQRSEEDTATMWLEPLPPQAASENIRTGVLPPLTVNYGMYRDYRPFMTIDGQSLPHVTVVAARARSEQPVDPPNPFRVDFIGQHRPLPTIGLSRIFSEDIIQELIKDKTVLVGFKPPFPYTGYSTPVTPDSSSMTPLQYHGLALQTVFNHNEVRFPRSWEILLCLVVVIGLALIIHQTYGSFIHLVWGGILFVIAPLASWLLLVFTRYWFPLGEVLLVYTLFLLLISARDGLLRNRLALRILLDQSLKKQEKVMPKSFFRSQEYWPLVVNMIKQTLNIERTIFLEAMEGDHRVREVIALNISLESIQERRRDYHRTPYKTAIEKNTAIPVDSYFKSLPENEHQYLVPLNFFGQVQGFWAFSIDTEVERQTPELLNLVNSLAREIGELLYRRKQWIVAGKWQNNPLRKLLNMEKHHEPYQEINRITAFLVRRLSVLESVFNALETGTILYNPFGMVVQSNRKMTQLSKTLNINAYNMSALDFAVHLTGENPEKIRQLLGRVIVNYETKQLSISNVGDNKQDLILKVRPLLAVDENSGGSGSQPIEMNGFLFEIIDMEHAVGLGRDQENVWLSSLKHVQGELESFAGNMEAALSGPQEQSEEEHCRRVWQEYDTILHSIRSLEERMHRELLNGGAGAYPVDVVETIKKIIKIVQPDAELRKIQLSLQAPDAVPRTLAVAEELMDLIQAIISLLIADALDGSTVTIAVELDQEEILCSLSNAGVGMPDETFQRFLSSPGLKDRIEFQMIHRTLPELKRWQAALSGSSVFGQGHSFRLTLTPFA